MDAGKRRLDARSGATSILPFAAIVYTVALAASPATAAGEITESAVTAEATPSVAEVAVTELRFGDFFRMPVGPRGLEPSPRLLALDGKTVRIRGYVVRRVEPTPETLILSPLPVQLGDADESLSDDLPPAVVYVHFDATAPAVNGLVRVTGTLELGPRDEADGHVSQVRLRANPGQAAAIERIPVPVTASVAAPVPNP
jgi:hypothetical protein